MMQITTSKGTKCSSLKCHLLNHVAIQDSVGGRNNKHELTNERVLGEEREGVGGRKRGRRWKERKLMWSEGE